MGFSRTNGSLDLATLRACYGKGELTPADLIDAIYERIERADHPNVWIHLIPKIDALAKARSLGAFVDDGSLPLWGVPFAVKDNIDVAGMPTTAACPAFSYDPARSAAVVQRLLDAGAICLGKTNMDQFATGLIGTRSPYGACRNVFNAEYVSGGSSSGSAVAVAASYVTFALGTDTAGSGRVPAALNNVVGVKPSPALLSTEGVVPACQSLDCVSVFGLCCGDAARVREVMLGTPELPSETYVPSDLVGLRIGVPFLSQLEFFDDLGARERFSGAIAALESLGAQRVEIDFSPFTRVGNMLYGGPWLAERVASVGTFIREHTSDCLPLTRDIVMAGERYAAVDAFRAQYEVDGLKTQAEQTWREMDVLLLPTAPTIYKIEDDARDGRLYNDRLGIYTRFVNFLGYAALSVPAGFKPDGLPFGVTLIMPGGCDRELDVVGTALERKLDVGMGKWRTPLSAASTTAAAPRVAPGYARVAVVGAHLRGQPLNHQLVSARSRFVRRTRTTPDYRMYALPNTTPPKPGLVRVDSGSGGRIELELWDVPMETYGALVAKVPSPLCIGTLRCEDGEAVQGFLCEGAATHGAEDITAFGGFRAYLAARAR